MPRQLFLHAHQILTLAGTNQARAGAAMSDLSAIEDGALAIDKGKIEWLGSSHSVPATIRDGATIHDCHGMTILPAWVDSHTHVVWAGSRVQEMELRLAGADYESIFAAGGGILSSVKQTRETEEEELLQQSLRRVRRMQASGTGTFEIKSGYGLDLASEIRQLRVARRLRDEHGFRIHATCLAAHAFPEEARSSEAARQRYVEEVCHTILPEIAKLGLADSCDVFCERGAFSREESHRVLKTAQELGMKLRIHANEFGHSGGAELAAEFGAASADHLLHLNDRERSLLRDRGVVATLLPGTSLVLGKPYADGRALVEAGVAVAVATDCNPGSCALENLALILGLASYGCRLSPAEAICAATHNAAASLGLSHEVGRLEPGMSADFQILKTKDYRDLVYHATSPFLDRAYVRGEAVFPP